MIVRWILKMLLSSQIRMRQLISEAHLATIYTTWMNFLKDFLRWMKLVFKKEKTEISYTVPLGQRFNSHELY
jgi:hypothetical protein